MVYHLILGLLHFYVSVEPILTSQVTKCFNQYFLPFLSFDSIELPSGFEYLIVESLSETLKSGDLLIGFELERHNALHEGIAPLFIWPGRGLVVYSRCFPFLI